jgi:hypothetical protein
VRKKLFLLSMQGYLRVMWVVRSFEWVIVSVPLIFAVIRGSMSDVTFGLGYSANVVGSVIGPLEYAERFEAAGYRSLFIPDLEVSPALDPMVTLAAIAQRTTRMRLGIGVLALPFRHPYQLAKTALSLSEVSGGRFVLGVGTGIFSKDFDVEDVDCGSGGGSLTSV